MAGRNKLTPRCYRCRMQTHLCLCSVTPRLDLDTRVIIVMHYREMIKTTCTGILSYNCLPNSELRFYGKTNDPLNLDDLDDPSRRLLVLYPSLNAVPLTRSLVQQDDRPVTLLVPDGTWRQVAHLRRRVLGLPQAETVKLPPGKAGEWTIRKTTTLHQLSTHEAIARALGILESPDIQSQLETVFHLMVQRIHHTRGHRALT